MAWWQDFIRGWTLEIINKCIAEAQGQAQDVRDEMDKENIKEISETINPVITGVLCQGYNAVMHSTWGRSNQHHNAQFAW